MNKRKLLMTASVWSYVSNYHLLYDIYGELLKISFDYVVTSKARSPELKSFVGESRPMYERESWGEYRVLDYKVHMDEKNSLTKEMVIAPDQHISYQRHNHRTEVWTFTEGEGDLILDDRVIRVRRGDVAVIKAGMKHAVRAIGGELHIIEIQIGDELVEEDIERIDWDW